MTDNVIFLPEKVVTGLLGRDLPASIGQEFNYDGKRYRVRQRDPSRSEGGVPCELVEPPVQEQKRGGRRAAGGSLRSWPFPSDGRRHRGRRRSAKALFFARSRQSK